MTFLKGFLKTAKVLTLPKPRREFLSLMGTRKLTRRPFDGMGAPGGADGFQGGNA